MSIRISSIIFDSQHNEMDSQPFKNSLQESSTNENIAGTSMITK